MRASAQHGSHTPRTGAASGAGGGASRRATGECPGTAGSATYRITCSRDELLGDGELHVERRQGSVQAWYERSSTPRRVTREAPPAADCSTDRVHGQAPAPRSSFAIVVHNQAGSQEEEAAGQDALEHVGTGSSPGRSPAPFAQLGAYAGEAAGVSWAANTLYDYLRGLHEAEAPVDVDRWVSSLHHQCLTDASCTRS